MSRMGRSLQVALALLATALVLLGLGRMPYGYYQVLRIVVCLTAVFRLLTTSNRSAKFWAWIFGTVAGLYNPFLPVHLPGVKTRSPRNRALPEYFLRRGFECVGLLPHELKREPARRHARLGGPASPSTKSAHYARRRSRGFLCPDKSTQNDNEPTDHLLPSVPRAERGQCLPESLRAKTPGPFGTFSTATGQVFVLGSSPVPEDFIGIVRFERKFLRLSL
jgi:hypothetical protein